MLLCNAFAQSKSVLKNKTKTKTKQKIFLKYFKNNFDTLPNSDEGENILKMFF